MKNAILGNFCQKRPEQLNKTSFFFVIFDSFQKIWKERALDWGIFRSLIQKVPFSILLNGIIFEKM